MKVITIGRGFIASHLPYEIANYYFSINEFDIKLFIDRYRPDVIINAVGKTGMPNIDILETQQIETYNKNLILPLMIAEQCKVKGIKLIHIGSGCIWNGPSPHKEFMQFEPSEQINGGTFTKSTYIDTGWKETDFANPQSFYSRTKYSTDLIFEKLNNVAILRIRMPISSVNHPRNLLNKLISYSQVLEQLNSMTFMDDFVRAVDFIIKNNKTGIYNITNPTPITHSVLLDEFKKYSPDHSYTKISVNELNNLVKATRSNCILDSRKIISEGFEFTPTLTSVHTTVKKFVENIKV